MKEALVSAGPTVRIVDSPVPVAAADQLVIKVVVSGSNPKDWKYPALLKQESNQGDDIAGLVYQVGSNVVEFKEGDRVAAFHEMLTPGGSYAEYAVAWSHTTFHIPPNTTFEGLCETVVDPCLQSRLHVPSEAATIPLAAMTAAFGLYQRLSLPLPWHPAKSAVPLIIYGAASAVGSFAVQLAVQLNIHLLICVAGRGIAHVEKLIDRGKGDMVLDYRQSDDGVVQGLKYAVRSAGGKIEYAFDCVSDHNSFQNISQVLDLETGQITLLLPGQDYSAIPDTVTQSLTMVAHSHGDREWQESTGTLVGNEDFAYVFFRYFARGLGKGYLKPHPFEIVPGGLEGVQSALQNLKDGKASAVKYVFRIADIEGVV